MADPFGFDFDDSDFVQKEERKIPEQKAYVAKQETDGASRLRSWQIMSAFSANSVGWAVVSWV